MSKYIFETILILALALLSACGGGTVGTGGGRQYSGTILDKSSQPVANAMVSIAQSGASTLTDNYGTFTINVPKPTATETFTITIDSIESTTTLEDIPDKEAVAVLFVVDSTTNSIEGSIVGDGSEVENPEVQTPDNENTDVDDSEESHQVLRADISLDATAPLVQVPSSPGSFQELNEFSAQSVYLKVFDDAADRSATTTLYFFRVSESNWEYHLYIDELEIPNGTSGRPYLLASGLLEFTLDGTLLGGEQSQTIEFQLDAQISAIVVDLSINANLRFADPVNPNQPKPTTAIELNATLAETTPLTIIPAETTFATLSANASSFSQAQVIDTQGEVHTLFFFFYRETDHQWQLIVSEVTAREAIVLSTLRFDFSLSTSFPLRFSRSTNITAAWTSDPFPQSIRLIANATISNAENTFNINLN